MIFSNLFRLEENLYLDKKTLVILRWIAIVGQLIAINLVYFFLKLDFPVVLSHLVIFIGLLTNLYLQFKVKVSLIKDLNSVIYLIYDLLQLSALLYLTGGISNPFSILLIIPAIVSSTFLSLGTTIILGLLTIVFLFMLTIFHYPLPGIHEYGFTFPEYYLVGFFISIIIGLSFLCYFGVRFAGETKKRSEAFKKLQQVLAKEYELESLGGQAAAAAHSLGTPLATITVVAKELRKEISNDSKYSKDLDLLISQVRRCGEILKQISQKQIIEDKFMSAVKFEDLLNEILRSFKEISEKKLNLILEDDDNKINIKRSPELIYGLRNFIGNAIKFSEKKVDIVLNSNEENVVISINDDGPGFPLDIIKVLGEPYIKTKYKQSSNKSGLGLGSFLGKTLLERLGAKVNFSNLKRNNGASVQIIWEIKSLNLDL